MELMMSKLKAKKLKLKAFLNAVLCFGLCAFSFQPSKAQSFSFSDLFGQSKKELKNMAQQIAALNACETSLRQGYNMLHSEWSAIGNFKNGEFGLHQDYYNSLSQVNPLVKNSSDLSTIQAEQQSIISQFNSLQQLSGLSASEQSYITAVRQNVIDQCAKDLHDLQTVLTSGDLVMSDDERIKRINQLTAAIKEKYLFSCSFCIQVRLMAIQRNQDDQNIQTLNQLYGINN